MPKATRIASSLIDSTVDSASLGPVGLSATEFRCFRLATVFWFVVALPCRTWPSASFHSLDVVNHQTVDKASNPLERFNKEVKRLDDRQRRSFTPATCQSCCSNAYTSLTSWLTKINMPSVWLGKLELELSV